MHMEYQNLILGTFFMMGLGSIAYIWRTVRNRGLVNSDFHKESINAHGVTNINMRVIFP